MIAKLTATVSANSPVMAGKEFTIISYAVPPYFEADATSLVAALPRAQGIVGISISGGDVTFAPEIKVVGDNFPTLDEALPHVTENFGVLGAWFLKSALKGANALEVDFAVTTE